MGSMSCYGFWCCPCLACTVSERFGENRCLPLCDICSPAILSALGIPLCVAPPAGLSLRAAMRNRYGIKVHCSLCVAEEVQHPMAAQDWSSGLCDCFESSSTCCYGFWCCPCLACTVSGRFGENRCLPLCDICSPAILSALGIPLFAAPPAGLSLRAAMRNRYGIKGSLCKDIAVSCFCGWCNWCQMHRELRHREKTPTVVNITNVNVHQPAPVMMTPVYQYQ